MKKDISKRVLCMVCCLSLTLGMFAYRPPEAKAVFASPAVALGVSLVASVMVATTANFVFTDATVGTLGQSIDLLASDFVRTGADAAISSAQSFFEEISSGAAILQNGAIQLSERAGSLMAKFVDWLQNGAGLFADGEKYELSNDYAGMYSYNGYVYPALPSTSTYSYYVLFEDDETGSVFLYASRSGNKPYGYDDGSGFGCKSTLASRLYECVDGAWSFVESYKGVYAGWYCQVLWSNETIYYGDGESSVVYFYGSDYSEALDPDSYVALDPLPQYQTIPNEIPDYSYLTVNPAINGLDFSDQQGVADAILNGLLAGTLSPTVSIEAQATDVPGTDTDEDDVIVVPGTDADILDWTKYIGQKVAAVPQAIAQAVAGVFAPDPVLVNDITGAFSQKFGFVEDLKQIGDDLFGMTPSSEPPVVWIHLENAEGKYNYGGTVKALDMSWFQMYKADVDRITGGFLWVAYLWLLFRRAPDILGGAGMVVAEGQYISEGTYVDGDTGEVTGHFTYRRSKRH